MRILLINNEFPPIGGGGSTVTSFVGAHLAMMGHDVRLVTSGYGSLPCVEKVRGMTVYRVKALRRHRDSSTVLELATYSASAMTFCLRLLREFKPDVIQAYFAVPAGAIAYSLWRLSGVPYCVYMGGSDVPGANRTRFRVLYPFLRPIVRRIWASSRLNTVASRGLLDLCLQTDPGRAFRLIPNGVELGIFRDSYETRARKLRSEPRAVRILTVGRLVPRKGFQHLIGSLPEVERRAKRPFVVQIVGSGDYEAFLRRTCNELGVEHLVQFVGQVSYEELVWYYSGADVFALVSLSEGMACALLEALASGLPAVVTNVEGNDDLVAPGRNGYLIDVGDLESLADGLVALVNDADLRQRMGRESIAVVQEYDWRHIAAQYDRAYRDIVAGLSVSKARR